MSSLRSGRVGCHVEVSLDDGTPLAVFRPSDAPSTAIAVDPPADVSARYRSATGIDLLAGCSASNRELVDLMSVAGHLGSGPNFDECDCDPVLAGPSADELAAQQQRASDVSQQHRRVRRATLMLGPALPAGAFVGFGQLGIGPSLGLIGASLCLSGACWATDRHRRRVAQFTRQLALDAKESGPVAAVVRNLAARLAAIRAMTGGESLPLFLEESVIRDHAMAWADFRRVLDQVSSDTQLVLFAN